MRQQRLAKKCMDVLRGMEQSAVTLRPVLRQLRESLRHLVYSDVVAGSSTSAAGTPVLLRRPYRDIVRRSRRQMEAVEDTKRMAEDRAEAAEAAYNTVKMSLSSTARKCDTQTSQVRPRCWELGIGTTLTVLVFPGGAPADPMQGACGRGNRREAQRSGRTKAFGGNGKFRGLLLRWSCWDATSHAVVVQVRMLSKELEAARTTCVAAARALRIGCGAMGDATLRWVWVAGCVLSSRGTSTPTSGRRGCRPLATLSCASAFVGLPYVVGLRTAVSVPSSRRI